MTRTVGGKTFQDFSIASSSGSSQTLLTEGQIACKEGWLELSNPNASGTINFNLAGGTAATTTGLQLAAGGSKSIWNPPNNKITCITSSSSMVVGCFAIPA